MGLFSFIETFFFISLAITFVLILLLVYHFKQRIITVEQKCDTMFDIINTMVQEIQYLRASQQRVAVPQFFPVGQLNNLSSTLSATNQYINSAASEEDGDYESSEESSDVGNSGDDEESDEESDDDEEQEAEVKKIVLLEAIENSPSPPLNEDETIKVVNMDNDIELTEIPIENDLESEIISEIEELVPINSEENIVVEKVEEVTTAEHTLEKNNTEEDEQASLKEVYSKMSTASLKQLVVQKGLCSDASKTRRPELLKLLESA